VVAGVFRSIEAAQAAMCLGFKVYEPEPAAVARYQRLYKLYRDTYFAFGKRDSEPRALGDVLPELRLIAAEAR